MNILSYRCLPESQCNTFDFLQVFKQPQNCSDFSNYEHSFYNLLQYNYYVHQGFHQVWYQSIMKATVSGVLEDLTFKISEDSDQNWSCPGSALLAVSGQLQFCFEPSEIWNLRSSNTPETVALNNTLIPWSLKNPESPNVLIDGWNFYCNGLPANCHTNNKSTLMHN